MWCYRAKSVTPSVTRVTSLFLKDFFKKKFECYPVLPRVTPACYLAKQGGNRGVTAGKSVTSVTSLFLKDFFKTAFLSVTPTNIVVLSVVFCAFWIKSNHTLFYLFEDDFTANHARNGRL